MPKGRKKPKPANSKEAHSRKPAAQKASAGEWRKVFLTTLASCGVVKVACHAAGIRRKAAYMHRKKCPKFAEQWDEAIEDACDVLEGIGLERAKKSSDGLLMFFLKANRPVKYRDSYEIKHKGQIDHDIRLTDAEREGARCNILARLGAGSLAEIRLGGGLVVDAPVGRSGDDVSPRRHGSRP